MATPNAKLDNGFECQNEDTTLNTKLKKMMVLNAKLKTWLWTPKIDESGSKCLKLEEMALNACIEDGGTECQARQWLWMPKWRHDFERQTKEDDGSKC